VGDILAFGKIFPPDWSYTERRNGLVRVFWFENNLGGREKMIWAPEEAIQTFDVPCRGADCAPWEGFTHHFTKEFLAHARIAMDRLGLGGAQAVEAVEAADAAARPGAEDAPPEGQADVAADADIGKGNARAAGQTDAADADAGIGKWRYASEVNPITDQVTIYCGLDSDESAGGAVAGQPVTLMMRLIGTKFELYMNTRFAVEPEASHFFGLSYSVRLDKEKPTALYFTRASDGAGVFFNRPLEQAKLLSQHKTFAVEIKPLNGMPRYAVFELEGMRACLARMQRDANVRLVGN
jgi:hypothetical protein